MNWSYIIIFRAPEHKTHHLKPKWGNLFVQLHERISRHCIIWIMEVLLLNRSPQIHRELVVPLLFPPIEFRVQSVLFDCTLALAGSTGALVCSSLPAMPGPPSLGRKEFQMLSIKGSRSQTSLSEPTMLPVEQCAVCGDDATSNKFVPHCIGKHFQLICQAIWGDHLPLVQSLLPPGDQGKEEEELPPSWTLPDQ